MSLLVEPKVSLVHNRSLSNFPEVVESRLKQVSRNFSRYYITYFDIIVYFVPCIHSLPPLLTEAEPRFIAVWSLFGSFATFDQSRYRSSVTVNEELFEFLALTLRKQPANSTLLALDWPPGSVTAPWMASPLRLSRISVSFEPSMKIALQRNDTFIRFPWTFIVWIEDGWNCSWKDFRDW